MSGGGEFLLTSAEFMDGAELPDAHSCASPEGFQGAPSPSFSWSGVPDGTQSFALVMIDKTLVDMGDTLGYHSAVWNLPASVESLPVDLATSSDVTAADVINRGYLGPCPTLGQVPPPHMYTFTLYALPEAMVSLGQQLNAGFVEQLEEMALGTAVLSCLSSASMN
jgi:Raf kinase inhibitor-like YbhB/YbcL family protein